MTHHQLFRAQQEELRAKLEDIRRRRDKIERNASSCVEALEEMGVGLRDPLVDEEGYPRSDVDLYTVRGLRHQHACLQVGLEWEEVGE